MTITLRDVFDSRVYDFDTHFCWNEEQDCVLRALRNTGEIISIIFGERGAAVSMTALRALLMNDPLSLDPIRNVESINHDWRGADFGAETIQKWPEFFEDIRNLHGFAEFGIFAPWDKASLDGGLIENHSLTEVDNDLPKWVRNVCEKCLRIINLAPEEDGCAPYDKLWTMVFKAQARLKYDEGQALTPEDLANLTNVTVKRIQNASYAGGTGAPVIDKKGFVTPESAREWLTRKGFKFSIWPEIVKLLPLGPEWGRDSQADPELVVNDGISDEEEVDDDFVFIPVASDQSKFLPEIRRSSGYQIGPKGAELEPIEDYFEALQQLSRQVIPHWRRPSEKGNWGIVAGRSWERIRKSVLQSKLDSLTPNNFYQPIF